MRVVVSVDVEPDAPPYLSGSNAGLRQGLPSLLDLFGRYGVRVDCFVLGRLARDSPGVLAQLAAAGHGIGCHGWDHRLPFLRPRSSLLRELRMSTAAIQTSCGQRPTAFRAPRFSLTGRLLSALETAGFGVDSSVLPHARLARAKGRIVLLDTPEVPSGPYRPARGNPWIPGDSSVVEVPVTEFPRLRGSPLGLGVLNRHGLAAVWEAARDADARWGYVTFVIHPWEAADLRAMGGPTWLRESASADLSALESFLTEGDVAFHTTAEIAVEAWEERA